MVELLLIADDWTGALDTGVQLAGRGVPTFVSAAGADALGPPPEGTVVLGLDTESRHCSGPQAARRVRAAAWARARGVPAIYKKTDSALRGNAGAELAALLGEPPDECLLFVPAYPQMGRTTRGGIQYVDGVPLHRSAFARDPLNPVRAGSIPRLLRAQTDRPVRLVREADLDRLETLAAEAGGGILLFDCGSEEHLGAIAAAIGGLPRLRGLPRRPVLLAGCAGFAACLPGLLGLPRTGPDRGRPSGGALTVCGSRHERSLAQVLHARERGYEVCALTAEELSAGGFAPQELAASRGLAEKAAGGRLILCPAGPPASGGARRRAAQEAARRLGLLARCLLEETGLETLVVIGGDTARAAVAALACRGAVPVRELVPGVGLSRLVGWRRPLWLVSKAGGFGEPDALLEIHESILKVRRARLRRS